MLARTLKHELLNSCVPDNSCPGRCHSLVQRNTGLWNLYRKGDFAIRPSSPLMRGYIGDPFSPVPILCEVGTDCPTIRFLSPNVGQSTSTGNDPKVTFGGKDSLMSCPGNPFTSMRMHLILRTTTSLIIYSRLGREWRRSTSTGFPFLKVWSLSLDWCSTDPFDQRSPVQLNSGEREPATLECVADDLAQDAGQDPPGGS